MLYHAARSCYLDLMDTGTIETVQLALQLAVFELNTKRANSARIGVAIAVRTAQALVRFLLHS